jgi:hypothetical protein
LQNGATAVEGFVGKNRYAALLSDGSSREQEKRREKSKTKHAGDSRTSLGGGKINSSVCGKPNCDCRFWNNETSIS